MKRNFSLTVILVFFSIIFIRTEAFGERSLYDNFTGPYIDAQKWYNREFVREVDPVNGKLVSKIGNASVTGTFRNMTEFQDPKSITTIACDITLVKTILDTGSYPTSFARIEGFFYNTQGSGGAKGDIWAAVIIGDRGSGLEAWWEVEEFKDDDMTDWVTYTGTLINPGEITYNTVYPTEIVYDGANGFQFTVDTAFYSYAGPTKLRDAITQIKTLTTGINAQGGSGTGYASALFGNVYINDQQLYDDFDPAPLDPSKWKNLESVTEISNGTLRSNVQADGSDTTAIIYATNRSAFYLEAEVAVESGGLVINGAVGAARVGGYYYNESRGPGSSRAYNKYEGNVWGDIRIEVDDENNLKAKAVVVRSNDANASVWTFRLSQDFITEIDFDTPYTLSIEFTGSKFIFKCEDESIEHEVTTNTYDPYNESRSLSSRVYAESSGQGGYVQANFDDMYIDYVPSTDTTDPDEEKGCFIATAAYGSPMEPHVKVLREFRDHFLLTNSVGQAFVKLYYMTSPPIADYISEHESLRTATRWSLAPVIYGVKHPKAIMLIVFGLGMVVAGYTRVRKR